MSLRQFVPLVAVVVTLFFGGDGGEAETSPARDPSDPAAPHATFEYRSAFAGYQSLLEADRKSWPAANEAAAEMGSGPGHTMPRAPGASQPAPDTETPPMKQEESGGHSRRH